MQPEWHSKTCHGGHCPESKTPLSTEPWHQTKEPQPLTSPGSYALLASSRLLLPIVSCVKPISHVLETLSGSPFSLASYSSIQQTPIHPSKPSCHCPLCILLLLSSINSWVIVAQMVKNLPTVQEAPVQSMGQEDPLEKEMATHSSILAWRIPWTEGVWQASPRGHKESDTTERLSLFSFLRSAMETYCPELQLPDSSVRLTEGAQ